MKPKTKKNKDNSFLSSVVDIFELPPEVILNMPLITLTGKERLTIENYTFLTEYSAIQVKISTKAGCLKIEGNNIKIEEITNDAILLRGCFFKLEYE